jgi:hypothetical protein
VHIRDSSAIPPFQPDEKMKPGFGTANFGPIAELLADGGYQCISARAVRGVGPMKMAVEVALADEIREGELFQRGVSRVPIAFADAIGSTRDSGRTRYPSLKAGNRILENVPIYITRLSWSSPASAWSGGPS